MTFETNSTPRLRLHWSFAVAPVSGLPVIPQPLDEPVPTGLFNLVQRNGRDALRRMIPSTS